ncbi:acetate--CoA ligase family protein [Candidatus Woesearchaeota archaeon]|nr:acetate--CoA ligase family protein [Candidatus Woesearchaeota archaeon]
MNILTEKEAEDFLEKNGFPVAKRIVTKDLSQAIKAAEKIRYPVVLKIVSKKILHKSDVGGVKLNIKNEEELKKAFDELKKIKYFEGAIVQEYLDGKYIICGLKKDETFGHVLVFGLGGIFTEVIKDVSFRVCPINKKEAEDMIKEIKGYQILKGMRGEKAVNLDSISNVLIKLSNLAQRYKNIHELDINPLIVNEKSSKVIDARIVFN